MQMLLGRLVAGDVELLSVVQFFVETVLLENQRKNHRLPVCHRSDSHPDDDKRQPQPFRWNLSSIAFHWPHCQVQLGAQELCWNVSLHTNLLQRGGWVGFCTSLWFVDLAQAATLRPLVVDKDRGDPTQADSEVLQARQLKPRWAVRLLRFQESASRPSQGQGVHFSNWESRNDKKERTPRNIGDGNFTKENRRFVGRHAVPNCWEAVNLATWS